MKKLIFLCLITMFSFQANANVVKQTLDSTIKATNEVLTTIDTNAVSKQLYTDVKAGIAGLATGLKVSAEHVWDIIVKQQLVYSLCFLVLIISSLFNWYWFYKRLRTKTVEIKYNTLTRDLIGDIPNPDYSDFHAKSYPGDPRGNKYIKGVLGKEEYNAPMIPIETKSSNYFAIVHLCICLTLSIFSFLNFTKMLTGFINPEYGAIQTIIQVIQK